MFYVEMRKYIRTRLFWALNLTGAFFLCVYSFFMIGAHQVGLMYVTGFDYLVGSMNFYLTNLLPFLFCLFAAYTVTSEFQWHTWMIPVFDGVARPVVIFSKSALLAVAILIFTGLYLLLSLLIASSFFSFQDILLESRLVSPAQSVGRIILGGFWFSFVLYPFGLLAMWLAIRSRNLLVSGLGAGLTFFALLLSQSSPRNPFAALLRVAQNLVQNAYPNTPDFLKLLLNATLINIASIIVLVLMSWWTFTRSDIVLE